MNRVSESIFSLMLRLSNSYYSVFHVTDSCLRLFHSAAESVSEFFISFIELFSSKISIWFFFIFFLFAEDFYLSSVSNVFHNPLLKYLMMHQWEQRGGYTGKARLEAERPIGRMMQRFSGLMSAQSCRGMGLGKGPGWHLLPPLW